MEMRMRYPCRNIFFLIGEEQKNTHNLKFSFRIFKNEDYYSSSHTQSHHLSSPNTRMRDTRNLGMNHRYIDEVKKSILSAKFTML